MHCPGCGCLLREIQNKDAERYKRQYQSWIDKFCKGEEPIDGSEAEHWVCTNQTCHFSYEDSPLVVHHPYGGPKTAPGDSWSISWVK